MLEIFYQDLFLFLRQFLSKFDINYESTLSKEENVQFFSLRGEVIQ